MEVLGRQPCKMEQELGWESFHPSSAHQLFDGMPSQPGLSKEDQRISEPVPINSTMNKEEKWLDEALDRILEKFEQMEAKRRQEDKLNQIFQKLEEIEARRSKASEETIAAIRATTAILKAASSPTPMAPPPPVPTNCLMECHNNNITLVAVNSSHIGEVLTPMVAFELGDVEDKDPVPYIVNKDSHDKDDSLLNLDTSNVIPVIAASSTSLLVHARTDSMMLAKCLKLGLNVNTSTVQTGVVFPLFLDELDIITAPGESMLVMVQRLGSVFFLKMLAHDGCSMKCARDGKLLMEPSNKNPWPPPWLGGVVRVCELRHAPWTELNSCWATGHLMPPWPPPIRPWPPSQQASFRFVPFQARNSECGNSVTALSTIAWNKWKKIRSTACDSCFEQEMKECWDFDLALQFSSSQFLETFFSCYQNGRKGATSLPLSDEFKQNGIKNEMKSTPWLYPNCSCDGMLNICSQILPCQRCSGMFLRRSQVETCAIRNICLTLSEIKLWLAGHLGLNGEDDSLNVNCNSSDELNFGMKRGPSKMHFTVLEVRIFGELGAGEVIFYMLGLDCRLRCHSFYLRYKWSINLVISLGQPDVYIQVYLPALCCAHSSSILKFLVISSTGLEQIRVSCGKELEFLVDLYSPCYSSIQVKERENHFLQSTKHQLNSGDSGQNTEESEYELTVKVYQYSPGDGSAIEKLFIDGLCSKKNSELCASAKYANYWLVRCLEDTEDKCPIHRMLLVVVVTWKVDAYAILRGAAIKIEQHLPCDIFHTRQASTEQVIKSYVSNSREIQELQMPWDPGGEKLSQFMLSACGQAEIQEKGIVRDSSGPYDGLVLTQALAQASPNGEATKQRQQQCSRRPSNRSDIGGFGHGGGGGGGGGLVRLNPVDLYPSHTLSCSTSLPLLEASSTSPHSIPLLFF